MIIKAKIKSGWEHALDCARMTVWKDPINRETPSEDFKKRLVISEHSPLRELVFVIDIYGLKSWVSVHLVRHFMGVEKYVSTQRTDRKEAPVPRDELPQGALVNMRLVVNAQALINISQSRLCHCASKETVQVWRWVQREVAKLDSIVGASMVPKCIYRGFCPEGTIAKHNCSYTDSSLRSMRKRYLKKFAEEDCIFSES